MKNASLILCLVIVILHAIGLPESLALSKDSGLYTRISYMLVHGNWMHVLINSYALLTLAFLCDIKSWHFIAGIIITSTIPFIGDVPMIGISTLIYAITGIIIMDSPKWWWFIIVNLLIIGAGLFMPGIAFLAHLYCFVSGVFVGLITSKRHGREIN